MLALAKESKKEVQDLDYFKSNKDVKWKIKKLDKEYRKWSFKYQSIEVTLTLCFTKWDAKTTKALVHNKIFQRVLSNFILKLGELDIHKSVYLAHHQLIDRYCLEGAYQIRNTKMTDVGVRWIESDHFKILV